VAGADAVLIDTGKAFGTGKHPTTRLCLEWLEEFSKGTSGGGWLTGKEVLDFGCGTGLLAIAAVKMGALKALGIELDADSVRTAKRNVALNGLGNRIEVREGSWDRVRGAYDLILCNLVPSALLRTGEHILGHLKEEGRVVISGMGEAQTGEMEKFYNELGFRVTGMSSCKGWGSTVLEKYVSSC
jgi:ribosomal protein L11 methyltransferase